MCIRDRAIGNPPPRFPQLQLRNGQNRWPYLAKPAREVGASGAPAHRATRVPARAEGRPRIGRSAH
eukprot:14663556-Alexandrium_andersonii.AAC.1